MSAGKAQPFYNPHWLGGAGTVGGAGGVRIGGVLSTGAGVGTPGAPMSAGLTSTSPGSGGTGGSVLSSLAPGQVFGSDRLDAQRAFFSRLLDVTKCYLFNSGVAGIEKLKEIVGK